MPEKTSEIFDHLMRPAQKMKFSIKDFSSKRAQIRSSLQILSYFLEKFLMENFIFCVVASTKLLKFISK